MLEFDHETELTFDTWIQLSSRTELQKICLIENEKELCRKVQISKLPVLQANLNEITY